LLRDDEDEPRLTDELLRVGELLRVEEFELL
jgi:hypothetical protein